MLNEQSVIVTPIKLNDRGNDTSIVYIDFTTLYIELPHNQLLVVLNELIDFHFSDGNVNMTADLHTIK